MDNIMWIEDKKKNDEIYTNSYCFRYLIKMFTKQNVIEVWNLGKCYKYVGKTKDDLIFKYLELKNLNEKKLIKELENNFIENDQNLIKK